MAHDLAAATHVWLTTVVLPPIAKYNGRSFFVSIFISEQRQFWFAVEKSLYFELRGRREKERQRERDSERERERRERAGLKLTSYAIFMGHHHFCYCKKIAW